LVDGLWQVGVGLDLDGYTLASICDKFNHLRVFNAYRFRP
jgi:hypothetical protein